jgi:hypothetical protein
MLASGLFTGDEWLRFTHLSLGEYLAASGGGFELATERRRDRERPERRAEEESALDVLALAHALSDGAPDVPLVDALQEAQNDRVWVSH